MTKQCGLVIAVYWVLGRMILIVTDFFYLQIVLMKDKKKCFAIDDLGYEPEAVAVHPGGGTVAVGGTVRLHFLKLYFCEYLHQ